MEINTSQRSLQSSTHFNSNKTTHVPNKLSLTNDVIGKVAQEVMQEDSAYVSTNTDSLKESTILDSIISNEDIVSIQRMITVISASNSKEAKQNILKLVNKIVVHTEKSQDPTFLNKVLELRLVFGKRIDVSTSVEFGKWLVENDLSKLFEVLIDLKVKHLERAVMSFSQKFCEEGDMKSFQRLAENKNISKKLICNIENLKTLLKNNHIEFFKFVISQFVSNKIQIKDLEGTDLLSRALAGKHKELADFLQSHSIGNLKRAKVFAH